MPGINLSKLSLPTYTYCKFRVSKGVVHVSSEADVANIFRCVSLAVHVLRTTVLLARIDADGTAKPRHSAD